MLPQMVYYAYAVSQLKNRNKKLRFIVPSGNMGNITAGLYSKKCGIEIDSFVIACNANDPVVDYLKTGTYAPKQSVTTLSSAMDIGNPSNFERILHMYHQDLGEMQKDMSAISISDKQTIQTIKNVYEKYDYLMDPHTAVAWKASELIPADTIDIIVSTAHPSKFATEIQNATGISAPDIAQSNKWPMHLNTSSSNFDETKKMILTVLTA
jgi:threonine synthase